MTIPETVSEKPRRGRPRSHARRRLDTLGPSIDTAGKTARTQLAWVYGQATTGYVDALLEPDDQRVFLGRRTRGDRLAAFSGYPRGYTGFAVEFGRWAEGLDAGTICQSLADCAACLRDGRTTFAHLAACYRKARLGGKAGTPLALARHLTRALDAYLRRFPATTEAEIRAAVGFFAYVQTRGEQEQTS